MKSEKCIRRIKKTISFLTVICCLMGSIVTAHAGLSQSNNGTVDGDNTQQGGNAGAGGSVVTPPPDTSGNRVVFYNEEDKVPVLRVTKTLLTEGEAPEGANPETDEFRFLLKVQKTEGGAWVTMSNQDEYTVYDAQGNLVTQNINGGEQTFFNFSSLGTFTLKAGQTAHFDFLKEGWNYEVKELDKDNYRLKTIKKNGVETEEAKGRMPAGSERIEMINRFKTGDGRLQVSKEIVFAGGYAAPEAPEFEFQVTLENKPELAGKPLEYTLYRRTPTGYLEEILPESGSESGNGSGTEGGSENETGSEPGNETESGTGKKAKHKTSADGKFTLKGGQVAVFEEIPEDAVYKVKELGLAQSSQDRGAEGGDWKTWWLVGGQQERTGLVSEAGDEVFKNSNVSFAVSKRLTDYQELPETKPEGMSDKDYEKERQKERQKMTFRFFLTDGDKGIKARYYLYHSLESRGSKRGQRVDDKIYETDDDGAFTLLAGQTAVFIGLEPGSSYKVREDASYNLYYTQESPADLEGYAVRRVGNSPETLAFVNKPAPVGLRVVKALINYKGEEPPDNETKFTFILEKKKGTTGDVSGSDAGSGQTAEYEPVKGAVYTVGEESYKTDKTTGKFTLKAYQEALFEQLDLGATYRVRELEEGENYNSVEYEFSEWRISYSDGTVISADPQQETSEPGADPQQGASETEPKSHYSQGAQLKPGQNLTFSCVNNYVPDKLDLELIKIDPDGNRLSGAQFKLFRGTGTNPDDAFRDPVTGLEVFETSVNGTVTIHDLKAGTYTLMEVKAPSGYMMLAEPISIEVVREGSSVTITVNGKTVKGKKLMSESGAKTGVEEVPNVKVTLNTPENDLVELTVYNGKLYNLPHAGGRGIYWYSISGMLLMMAAALILYRYKLRTAKEVGKD